MTAWAVQYDQVGGPDDLVVREVPDPEVSHDGTLVSVEAVGVNPFDLKALTGRIPLPGDFPRGIGNDFAGIVNQVGSHAVYADGTRVRVGDEVLGWVEGKAMTTLLPVPSANLARKPALLGWAEAGALTTPGLTALAETRTITPRAGETVLIGGAAGGVGYLTSQLLTAAGAHVIGIASEANRQRLTSIGVTPLTYGSDLAARVQALGVTVDWALDNHGRETIDAALQLGVPTNRICGIVDHQTVADLGLLSPGRYVRRATDVEHLARMLAQGSLRLPIEAEFDLHHASTAFRQLASGPRIGKIVVRPSHHDSPSQADTSHRAHAVPQR